MKVAQLQTRISTPFFTTLQAQQVFTEESSQHVNVQLSRMAQRGLIVRLRRNIFLFPKANLDEFFLANMIYPQSYVSVESALHNYGVIPDVPAQVTSITPLTPKRFITPKGTFTYSKIDPKLYFGFRVQETPDHIPYRIAEPEKALLDYIYIRKIKNLSEHRVDAGSLDMHRLQAYIKLFPKWVRKAMNTL